MEPVVPLQYEFQINGRVNLTVLGTGLHQGNLTVNVDIVDVNGESIATSTIAGGDLTGLKNAIKTMLIGIKTIPA